MVPWMSGLVNGLQNRLRRFESARHLRRSRNQKWFRLLFLHVFLYICDFHVFLQKKCMSFEKFSVFLQMLYVHILNSLY